MKKKIVNVFLVAALFVVAAGTFVSCKDNEDDYLNLQSQIDEQIGTLQTLLQSEIDELQQNLESTQENLESSVESLQGQIDDINDAIVAVGNTISELEDAINGKIEDLQAAHDEDIETLQGEIDDLQAALDTKYEELTALINAKVSCECDLSALQSQIDAINSTLEEIETNYTGVESDLSDLVEQLSTLETSTAEAQATIEAAIDDLEATVETLSSTVTSIESSVTTLETTVSGISTDLSELLATVSNLSTTVSELSTTVSTLETTVSTLETELKGYLSLIGDAIGGIRDSVLTLWAQVYLDSEYIANLQKDLEELSNKYTDLENRFTTDSTNVWDYLSDLSDRCDTLSDYVNSQLTKVYSYIDGEIAELSEELTAAFEEGDSITLDSAKSYAEAILAAYEEEIDDSLESLRNDLTSLYQQVQDNTEEINALKDRVTTLEEEMLARYVTSIIVQGTENDCFGTFALPLGIRSNILMGYYGYWNSDGTFPTTSNGYNVDGNSYLDDNVLAILVEAGLSVEEYTDADILGLNEDNNIDAGTLYLTVNPTSVDFEDLSVSLENSKGVESGVLLEDLEESDALLTFGYTRSSDNGFYETKAYIPYDNISDVKVNVESGLKSELTSALKSAISGGNISFSGLIGTIYDQFNGILPALAVKTGWTDEDDGTEYSVYSEYSVAATTFQPLSFKFLQNTSYSIPTISTLSYIDLGDFDEINIELDYTPVEYTYEEQTISISFSEITINIETDSIGLAYEHPLTSEDEDGNRYYEVGTDGTILAVSDTLWFHTDSLTEDLEEAILEMLADMEEEINEQLNTTINELMESIVDDIIAQINNTISEMIENINTQLDGINDLIDSFNGIQETLDSYIDLVNTYISRINTVINRINSYLTNVNHYLQVAMLYEGEDGGLGLVGNSQSLYYVTMKAGSSAVLHPTTYTAELVVPCAKKFVAVTNVYSGATDDEGALADSDLKNLMIEANQASDYLNTVLDGNTRAIEFTIPSGAESGQIFEITYAAVDYHGYTSYNKYYIGVK